MVATDWIESGRSPARVTEPVPEWVQRRIARLPVRYRDFLEMELVERCSEREICAALEIPHETCRDLKRLADSALRASCAADSNSEKS